jgi:catechol 2,3-dioxygenase-like lactoylglutathione lyase family enzyme
MPLSAGCSHIALVTEDLDRFIDFYHTIFDANVRFSLDEGELRHALIDLGASFALHPFEFVDGNPNARASDKPFGRGHLDHLALNVDGPEAFEMLRARLVEAGATDGMVTDFGAVRTVWFEDPDGMGGEIAIWSDGPPRHFNDRIQEAYAITSD